MLPYRCAKCPYATHLLGRFKEHYRNIHGQHLPSYSQYSHSTILNNSRRTGISSRHHHNKDYQRQYPHHYSSGNKYNNNYDTDINYCYTQERRHALHEQDKRPTTTAANHGECGNDNKFAKPNPPTTTKNYDKAKRLKKTPSPPKCPSTPERRKQHIQNRLGQKKILTNKENTQANTTPKEGPRKVITTTTTTSPIRCSQCKYTAKYPYLMKRHWRNCHENTIILKNNSPDQTNTNKTPTTITASAECKEDTPTAILNGLTTAITRTMNMQATYPCRCPFQMTALLITTPAAVKSAFMT